MNTRKRVTVSPLFSRLGAASALTAAAIGTTLLTPWATPEAKAASPGSKALRVAASKEGAPYKWGATGPHRFDCSGLTLYSFKQAGKRLPRTAAAQYNRARQVSPSARTRGDLVFFRSSRSIYHVGIYAGRGRIWHAPKTGAVVRLERIWSNNISYGRVH
ncbi:C40 family peptidase [Streptomyces zagrosensis]|uniref:Cell wall-associated NlpC family hydrolase n=1 Tax=Streptomyces zagrosensis TaxID=1042984 RepID=A0A7W9UZJ5_9ACTN|nr:C40 family peptidase [Streptomyces zagrosensis]MBB5937110.1 cell wall-associated NlpC family hydrolase [Streptomyces zagrosensis]